jgi:hypothetical protein
LEKKIIMGEDQGKETADVGQMSRMGDVMLMQMVVELAGSEQSKTEKMTIR